MMVKSYFKLLSSLSQLEVFALAVDGQKGNGLQVAVDGQKGNGLQLKKIVPAFTT